MRQIISVFIILSFVLSLVGLPKLTYAHEMLVLPAPGAMVNLSAAYVPVLIKGLRVHPENPLLFDFILDTGNSGFKINSPAFKDESQKLIKYFLASMTIKEDDLWVNLSPYEKDRTIPNELGKTELGRDMLAQDYILKQLTASLIYPEKHLGKEFWSRVYARAQQEFGTSDIPVNTFNKVWIVADKAKILERNNVGYVVAAHLKVMLEEDYLSLRKHNVISNPVHKSVILSEAKDLKTHKDSSANNGECPVRGPSPQNDTSSVGSQILREIIIPELDKEVNNGGNFAPLRQMFYSMILASWHKLALKEALLNQVYSNKNKTGGVLNDDPNIKENIFQQYLKAYKKGVFNFIKEDMDAASKQPIPRKYFSGGERFFQIFPEKLIEREKVLAPGDSAQTVGDMAMVTVGMAEQISGLDAARGKDTLSEQLKATGYISVDSEFLNFERDHLKGRLRGFVDRILSKYGRIKVSFIEGETTSIFHSGVEQETLNWINWFLDPVWASAATRYQVLQRADELRIEELDAAMTGEKGRAQEANNLMSSLGVETIRISDFMRANPTQLLEGKQYLLLGREHLPSSFGASFVDNVNMFNQGIVGQKEHMRFTEDLLSQYSHIIETLKQIREWIKQYRRVIPRFGLEISPEQLTPTLANMGPTVSSIRQQFRVLWPKHYRRMTDDMEIGLYDSITSLYRQGTIKREALIALEKDEYKENARGTSEDSEWELLRDQYMADQIMKMPVGSVVFLGSSHIKRVQELLKARGIQASAWVILHDAAMVGREKKKLAGTQARTSQNPWVQGGIDLNARKLHLDVDGSGIQMQFDPAMVAEFRRGDFSGIVPIIIRITPVSVSSILNLDHKLA